METTAARINHVTDVDKKITVEDHTFWTRPWVDGKAMITTNDVRLNCFLFKLHQKDPEYFEIMMDEDICEEDLEGAFSVIVDPEAVQIIVYPGTGDIGISVDKPADHVEVSAK